MLRPSEFLVGTPDETDELSLLIPFSRQGELLLVSQESKPAFVIMIGEQHPFYAYAYSPGDRWKGLIISGVSIEIDEKSCFDPEREYMPYGAVVRESDKLSFAARIASGHPIDRQELIPLVSRLPLCGNGSRAGFRTWRIVFREGLDKQVLREFSVQPAEGPPR